MPFPEIFEKLANLVNKSTYKLLSNKKILSKLKVDSECIKEINIFYNDLISYKIIIKVKENYFKLTKDIQVIYGYIKFNKNRSAILKTINQNSNSVFKIEPKNTGIALNGDYVLAITDKYSTKVIKVLKRSNKLIAGTLRKNSNYYYIISDDNKIPQKIIISDSNLKTIQPIPKLNDKIIVKLLEWESRSNNLFGEIIDVLGITHSSNTEFNSILYKYGLNIGFSKEALTEINQIPKTISEREIINRKDCRNVFTFTVDPDDAKDFDDAISIEYLLNGDIKVGIHVADVSFYIKDNTILDKEAKARGNSTYLVGQVIPMLPFELSNGICSLLENEDRLTKCIFVQFSSSFEIKDISIHNSVINSNYRLNYQQACIFIKEIDLKKINPLIKKRLSQDEKILIQKNIKCLWSIANLLRNNRIKKGSLDIDMPEIKIHTNEKGFVNDIKKVSNNESHQLIEEFMLLANEAVAKIIFNSKVPSIYRVHDKPDNEKLIELRKDLITKNIPCNDLSRRESVMELLNQAKNHSQGYSIKIQFLRSLKQACYRTKSDGHYGLYKKFYTHFTSPIRRYSDLIIHRILDNFSNYNLSYLEKISKHLTITEQNSTEAERESVKIKLLEFFENENKKIIKKVFRAIITDVRSHGLFIELSDSLAFGFIPISSLNGDTYFFRKDNLSIVGKKFKRKFIVGTEIDVVVNKVDHFQRQIDFLLYN